MDVMVFSDNVPPEAELALKTYARERGPDGDGARLRHGDRQRDAARVRQRGAARPDRRRRRIGHRHAGGHRPDPPARAPASRRRSAPAATTSPRRSAASRCCTGCAALDGDPATKVIVLVSKPPRRKSWRRKVLAAAEASAKPVVVIFLGGRSRRRRPQRCVRRAPTWRRPPTWRSRSAGGEQPLAGDSRSATRCGARSARLARCDGAGPALCPRHLLRRHVLLRSAAASTAAAGIGASLQHAGRRAIRHSPDIGKSQENTIIDMGDDEFTQGRPHPMIDPSLRDSRIRDEIADPTTAVVLVRRGAGLRLGRRPDRRAAGAVRRARPRRAAAGRTVAFIGYVCGTDHDPQDREQVVSQAGVRRRPGGLDQRRGRGLVGRAHLASGREPTREDAVPARPQGGQRRAAGLRRQHRARPAGSATQLSLGAARRGRRRDSAGRWPT